MTKVGEGREIYKTTKLKHATEGFSLNYSRVLSFNFLSFLFKFLFSLLFFSSGLEK
jgi:hypothetical protein